MLAAASTMVAAISPSPRFRSWPITEAKNLEPALRKMASSYRISRVRQTSISRKSKNDYRFEVQGGLNERKDDSVF